MAEKAFITPSVIKWARETARFSIEDAAKKMSKEPELLIKWESGEGVPTISQAEKLAKIYRRPFALFFLPGPPKDFQPLQDFRQPGSKALSTASAFIIREISENQAWMREVAEDSGEKKLGFIGRFTEKDNPKAVAEDILRTLGVDPIKYEKSPTPLLQWIRRAEAVGINVSRASSVHNKLKIDPEELQGFAIADPFAPFVFINSADWERAQLFTLVHELAHLWINASGISNEIELRDKSDERLNPVERFCNKVAGNVLMPREIMEKIKQSGYLAYEVFKDFSSKYGVSSFALLVRAKELDIINWSEYKNLKEKAENEYIDFIRRKANNKKKQKEKEGGPSYYILQLNKNGRLFTQHVLDAYYDGAIMATEASGLLNIKINKIANIRAAL
ncbi:MAG: ImmA/IrrE family metallo-endopeptidase [Chloroflexota bacterium]